MKNVVALPHIGSSSVETRTKMIERCCENITAVLQKEKPINVVNKELYEKMINAFSQLDLKLI